MEYVKALIIKFILCTAVVWLVLGAYYGVRFSHVLMLGLILTVVSFVIGDLFILPRFENWGATIADFLLVFATVWLYGVNVIPGNFPVLTGAAVVAILISIGEVFFHRYMDIRVLHVDDSTINRDDPKTRPTLNTEFGKEITPLDDDHRHDK